MTVQCLSSGALAVTSQIHRRCVKVVDAVLQGVVNQAVNLILIYNLPTLLITFLRPAHATVTKHTYARIVLKHLSVQVLV